MMPTITKTVRLISSAVLLSAVILASVVNVSASDVPFTYVIDYSPNLIGNTEFYEKLKVSPPDLYHVGPVTPFHSLWGAGDGYGAGHYPQASPERIRERIEEISAFVQEMKRAGVKEVCPYIFSMGMWGDHEKRTGFWEFYDNWDQYREFGFGPRPLDDPYTWMQMGRRKQEGHDFYFYQPCVNHPGWRSYLAGAVRNIARCGYDGVFMDVNTLMCTNEPCQKAFDVYLAKKYSPAQLRQNFGTADLSEINLTDVYNRFERCVLDHFRTFLEQRYDARERETLFATADVGTLRLENDWRLLRCVMQESHGEFVPQEKLKSYLIARCGTTVLAEVPDRLRPRFVQIMLRSAFQEYLGSEFLKSVLRERFGTDTLQRRGNPTPRDLLLWAETQMFWSESMAGLFRHVRDVGRQAREQAGMSPEFFLDANVGTMAHIDGVNKRRVNAIDLNRWADDVDYMLFEEMQQPGMLSNEVIVDYIFHHKWAYAAGTRGCMLVYKVQDEYAAELANAEAAAGGSAGALIQPGMAAPEARRKYRAFFENSRGLFENNVSYADVAVAFFFDQTYYENIENLRETYQLVLHFSDNHVLFDLITERNFDDIYRYRAAILPDIRFMSEEQIATAESYAAQGGNLIIIGDTATRYMNAQPRPRPGFEHLFDGVEADANGVKMRRFGGGSIAWCRDPRVLLPERGADIFNLMEERANALYDTMDYVERAIMIEETSPALILDYIRKIVGEEIAVAAGNVPASLRLSAYIVPAESDGKKIVVHLVNYNLPIVKDDEKSVRDPESGEVWQVYSRSLPPMSARNVEISMRLPQGTDVVSVKLHDPKFAAEKLEFGVENGKARFVVPKVHIYKAVEIVLASAGQQTTASR